MMKRVLAVVACMVSGVAASGHLHGHTKFGDQHKLPTVPMVGICNGCTISASPTVLAEPQSWVKVTIEGITFGKATDWVGVFSPGDLTAGDVFNKYPIRWQSAAVTCWPRDQMAVKDTGFTFEEFEPLLKQGNVTCWGAACCAPNEYVTTGYAVLSFQLINQRRDHMFVLVQEDAQFPSVVAISNSVSFQWPNEPSSRHLSVTDKPGEMRLTFSSGNVTSAQVRYGKKLMVLDKVATTENNTYVAEELCGSPAISLGFQDPGHIFTALLTDLEPGQRYFYHIEVDDAVKKTVPGHSFVASVAAGPSVETEVICFGDMGKAPNAWDGSFVHSWDNPPGLGEMGSWDTTKRILLEGRASMIVHIGDISYAVGYGSEWDDFLHQIEPISSRIPWMTSVGNHEADCTCRTDATEEFSWLNATDSGGECGVPYYNRFKMPNATADKPWYSFRHGPITFIMMSTEHLFHPDSPQYQDLVTMMQEVDRSVTPWLIFTGHRPMYCDTGGFGEPASDPLIKYIEPLLLKYHVDLAMWGHHHSYQRTCPLINGKCTHDGVVHTVIGAAGFSLSKMSKGEDVPFWRLFGEDEYYGFGRIRVNSTNLVWDFVRSDNGDVEDQQIFWPRYAHDDAPAVEML